MSTISILPQTWIFIGSIWTDGGTCHPFPAMADGVSKISALKLPPSPCLCALESQFLKACDPTSFHAALQKADVANVMKHAKFPVYWLWGWTRLPIITRGVKGAVGQSTRTFFPVVAVTALPRSASNYFPISPKLPFQQTHRIGRLL